MPQTEPPPSVPFITPEALLEHWQGHRRLTRRTIDAFPEDKLFSFRVEPMRPFGLMALEIIGMAVPMVQDLLEVHPARRLLRVSPRAGFNPREANERHGLYS